MLHGLEIDIADGEFVSFLGPSGCGKSTLLFCIAGLEEITAGEIRLGDRVTGRTPPHDRNIALVFQDYALYPHMRVRDNIASRCSSRASRRRRCVGRWRGRRSCWGWRRCWTACRRSCAAGSGSAWRWAAPSCAIRPYC